MTQSRPQITVGVLALQGAFSEHLQLLQQAAAALAANRVTGPAWRFTEVRTPAELDRCDALIIPGGESTTMSLVASRSGMLEPLRDFVKAHRKPTWGTCAGLILLAESANKTKKGGQELIGGLDVRVERNHFGRQVESFTAELDLPFLSATEAVETKTDKRPFRSVFIRAPVVEKILPHTAGMQVGEAAKDGTIVAPSRTPKDEVARKEFDKEVEIMARLPGRAKAWSKFSDATAREIGEEGDIIAVRQGNVFGTSFHPELTGDERIHVWWLEQVLAAISRREESLQ